MTTFVTLHVQLLGLVVVVAMLLLLTSTQAIWIPQGHGRIGGGRGGFGPRPGGGLNFGKTKFGVGIGRGLPPGPDTETTEAPIPTVPASYWVTFSTRIRPGIHLAVTVHLVNDDAVSGVSVTLRNSSDESIIFAEATPTIVKGGDESDIIYLEIPKTLERPDPRVWCYIVRVVGEGDVSFNESRDVMLYKSFSIFVQTDKAMYKPGETVKFRALAMNPDLTVLNEPMDIFVQDAQGNGMKLWKNVTGFNNTGVVERKIPTSTDPPLGDWVIKVTVLGQTEEKTFSIKKYVLPKFETILEVPEKLPSTVSAVKGRVIVRYTFGKSLTKAEATITMKCAHFYLSDRKQPELTYSGKLNATGELDFIFYKSEIEELFWKSSYSYPRGSPEDFKIYTQRLVVIANVTDIVSGKKMGAVSVFSFTNIPAILKFLPITPLVYKPGLKYTAYVSLTKFDGTLFDNGEKINVDFNVTIAIPRLTTSTSSTTMATTTVLGSKPDMPTNSTGDWRIPVVNRPPGLVRPSSVKNKVYTSLITFTRRLPASGLLVVDLDIPPNAVEFNIEAFALNRFAYNYVDKAKSPSSSFIQVLAQTSKPKVGQEAKVTINATEPVKNLYYQLYSKGFLLKEGKAEAEDKWRRNFTVSFPVTASMAPTCRVLAFHVKDSGEVVADTMSLTIDASSEVHVNVSYNEEKVKPGEEVQLKVQARANSTVFLLGIDKSVKLLKSGNDITQDMVDKQLAQFDFNSEFHGFWRMMTIHGWLHPTLCLNSGAVFDNANVAMLTDGYVAPAQQSERRRNKGTGNKQVQTKSTKQNYSPVEVRKFFPETWLFSAVFIGPEGHTTVTKTAPDTITTWLISAFSVHPHYGLSVLPKPAELVTFKKTFVSVDLPYSAIRGEDLCLKAFAFNYHDKPLYMRLTIQRQKGLSNIRLVKLPNSRKRVEWRVPMRVTHFIGQVDPNQMADTKFCFTPTTLGRLAIRVNLTSSQMPGDGVERELLVEPEGTPQYQTHPVILDVSTKEEFQHQVPITFPKDTVRGSQRITVAVAADLLGPVFDGLEDLLRMPYGCGEQNMLYFAPNVFLIDYLKRTNTYTPEVAEKAEEYMMVGYQKELKYKHEDSSYSAFGQRSSTDSGSMWLTAFVTKCFLQSIAVCGEVVSVDPESVIDSIMWMMSKQLRDGSFPEPGKVFNKNMQGGSAKGEALTAYVLIALAEANKTLAEHLESGEISIVQKAITIGRIYLEEQLDSLNDTYDLAIVTYVLHLTHSKLADHAFDLLDAKAIHESMTLHWERKQPTQHKHYYSWMQTTAAINIEMTAYCLLTYLLKGDVSGALPIVRWLTNQRGPQGGFISTQDTVLALQGLAQIAADIYQPTFTPINVTVGWSNKRGLMEKTVVLDDRSKLLLHKVEVPIEGYDDIPTELSIKANTLVAGNFSGLAVAEVIQDYNVLKNTSSDAFWLHVRVQSSKTGTILCLEASRKDGVTGGMTIIEIKIPTGLSVDEDSEAWDVESANMAGMEKDNKYVLYYQELTDDPVTACVPMVETTDVIINTQDSYVKIYEYYERSTQMVVHCRAKGVIDFCQELPDYEMCPFDYM